MMECQKDKFQLPDDATYLNWAYKSPLLQKAEEAAIRALKRERNPALLHPDDFFDEVEEAKSIFAGLVNCRTEEVAVMPSASYGFASVLNNIKGEKGQHAITLEQEFPSGYYALEKWCGENECELKVIGPGEGDGPIGHRWNDRIVSSINNQTALVLMSTVHWAHGLKFDIDRISEKCGTAGARLVLDGTQSVGVAPLDVGRTKPDALVCSAYKWLLGPYSMALSYIGPRLQEGRPIEESWMNRTNARNFSALADYDPNYRNAAARYCVGETSNLILMPMLIEGLRQIRAWGVDKIQSCCNSLMQPLLDFKKQTGSAPEPASYRSSHITGIRLPSGTDLQQLKKRLAEKKIYVSVRGEDLRVSVHPANAAEDVQTLITAIEK